MQCDLCDARHESGLCMVGFEQGIIYDKSFWPKAIEIVEKWSKAHPKETRKMELLKNYPNIRTCIDGTPPFCVRDFGYSQLDCDDCSKCWNKEVK